ncbi:NAD-dependent epimerase/dehydratase family protein [Egicoccus halophilus]|uniref:Nucleoside-diphosphate sugar epimerase n=1 Tax=Egicoccus halophilus TaxID=1670830 RepID=A0A8J3AE02_9ACTN|nr:NAD-dependent epimerase/dehydratase family protein [Egicoccus halophilus]GGI05196.1 nucleoside-diphosphate sugar epimerase [Egicoccus halophilus]
MKVLVTGASGFYGGAVAAALAARGDEVTTLQRRAVTGPFRSVRGDVTDPAVAAGAVAGQDAVVHLAARVGVVGSAAAFAEVNVGGTSVVLDVAREAGVGRFVYVSSPSVAHVGRSLVGAPAAPADPEHARGPYARTKAEGERLALAADADGFAVVAIRPHLVWGPGDEQLVGRIVARARAGRLALIEDGAALIDTTYVDNAVEATLAALDRAEHVHGRAFVVTNGEPRPVRDVLGAICEAAGVPVPTSRVPFRVAWGGGRLVELVWELLGREDDPPMTAFLAEQLATAHWFDQRETREALGWQPRVSFDEGMARLAASLRR